MKWGLSSNRSSILSPSLKWGEGHCRLHRMGWGSLVSVRLWSKQQIWVWRPLSGRVSPPDHPGDVITGFGLWNISLDEPQLSSHLFSVLIHSHCLWSSFAGCSQGPTEGLSSSGSPPLRACAHLLPLFSEICFFGWVVVTFSKGSFLVCPFFPQSDNNVLIPISIFMVTFLNFC